MFLTGRGTLASCPRQEETRNQRVPVAAAGSGPLAGKLARVPRVVRMSVSAEKSPTRVAICCRKADPFQGPKLGSCLTLGNELPEETHELTRGVVPKLVRQHILLTLKLKMSDPGPPNSIWKKLQQ